MRKILSVVVLILSLNCFADIDNINDLKAPQPTAAELSANRACFSDLDRMGCGDPGDDIEHFRSCMNNIYPDLKPECKTLMNDLYKSK